MYTGHLSVACKLKRYVPVSLSLCITFGTFCFEWLKSMRASMAEIPFVVTVIVFDEGIAYSMK